MQDHKLFRPQFSEISHYFTILSCSSISTVPLKQFIKSNLLEDTMETAALISHDCFTLLRFDVKTEPELK